MDPMTNPTANMERNDEIKITHLERSLLAAMLYNYKVSRASYRLLRYMYPSMSCNLTPVMCSGGVIQKFSYEYTFCYAGTSLRL